MRIWVHDSTGHPFQVELSRALARLGNDVVHTYCLDMESPKGSIEKRVDDPKSLQILPLSTGKPFPKYNYVRRVFAEWKFGAVLVRELHRQQPLMVIASNLSIISAARLNRSCRQSNVSYVHWLQDIYGRAASSLLSGAIGVPVASALAGLERYVWRNSAKVVAISEDFREDLRAAGVTGECVHVIPNWATLEELPVRLRNNHWSTLYGLGDSFVFMYTGTLGLKHNPQYLLELSDAFSDQPDVKIVVCSEGVGADYLYSQIEERNNILLLPFQDYSEMADVMGAADVLIVLLEASAGRYSVPSKTLSYMCAGRSVLMSGPLENLASQILEENGAGIVVESENDVEFVRKAKDLYFDPELRERMGVNARAYAEATFRIDPIADRFMAVLNEIDGMNEVRK